MQHPICRVPTVRQSELSSYSWGR